MNKPPAEIRILLVDDHQLLRQGLRQLIAAQPGLTVVGEAFNRQSVMDQIPVAAPNLILMDLHLEHECGVEITRRILAEHPRVRVVALSGDADLKLVLEALHAGVSGYVVKENGSDELFRAVRAVMDNHLYLSPEVASAVIRDFMKSHQGRPAARAGGGLRDRERLLLRLVAEGKRNKEIAGEMAVTVKSVETYRSRLMRKLGCASAAELVRYAIREGIIQA